MRLRRKAQLVERGGSRRPLRGEEESKGVEYRETALLVTSSYGYRDWSLSFFSRIADTNVFSQYEHL